MVPTAPFASRAIISMVAFSTPRQAKTRAAAVMIRAARASFSARRRSRNDALTRATFRELEFMNMNSRYKANQPECQTRCVTSRLVTIMISIALAAIESDLRATDYGRLRPTGDSSRAAVWLVRSACCAARQGACPQLTKIPHRPSPRHDWHDRRRPGRELSRQQPARHLHRVAAGGRGTDDVCSQGACVSDR